MTPIGVYGALFLCGVTLAAGPAVGFWRWSRLCVAYAEEHGLTVVWNRWWHKTETCKLADASGATVWPHFGVVDHASTLGLVVAGWVVAGLVCSGIWIGVVAIRARTRPGGRGSVGDADRW